ncbi:flavin reductase family protein [Actinoplanes sp. NPDC051346]|uniref:flavin reductase family protein n=1 Tax=Actinoplanes sp. NPDC051346 TaxID=3155048 RepID=UPI00342BE74C
MTRRPVSTRGPDREVAISREEYRDLMSGFPTGVAVVTGLDVDGNPCGMTCSSLTSVTLDPPTLLVCLRLGSRTATAVRDRGAFAINLLHAGAQRTAQLFAAPLGDRFSEVSWELSPAGLPWLPDDATALAECAVARTVVAGDHSVVFGRVERTVQLSHNPLLFGMRRFQPWEPPAVKPATSRHREENR